MVFAVALLVVIAHTLCVRGDYHLGTYSRSKNAVKSNPKWMRHLCDDLAINKVSIPGTHKSMTGALTVNPDIPQTQTMSLRAQLDSGIRFVDIHPMAVYGKMKLEIHGDALTGHRKFKDDVLDVIIDFLKSNPSEFVMMRVKPYFNYDIDYDFLSYIQAVYTNSKYEPYLHVNDHDIPTVGEVRGKIVPIRKHSGSGLC